MVDRYYYGISIYRVISYCHLFNILFHTPISWIQLAINTITYYSFMRSTHLLHSTIITIILCLFSIASFAQPKLTVVVIVDGMTQENLTKLRPFWSAGGLRIMAEESFQTTLDFPHLIYGGHETTATLMTGTTPSRHGLMADQFFSRSDRHIHAILHDEHVSGIGTTYTLSPKSILSTTISDEWRIQYGENAKIYSIANNPQSAIIMAGHAANACCWLDHLTLKWASTSFYPEGLPAAADAMNVSGRINQLSERVWIPRMDIAMYTSPTKEEKRRLFNYLTKEHLKSTANTLIIELALNMQQTEKLGEDHIPDILFLQLNTLSPKASSDMITSAEQEDMYLGINQDLGFLIEQLNSRIGKQQYQLLVIGRPVKGYNWQKVELAGIPIQHFNVDRAAALTSTYLMALYGHERWVDGGYGPFIYLNRTLIEKKRLSLETIQRQVANFLMDFEGIQVAYPIHEAINSEYRQSIYRKHAGDVFFQLQDYWVLDCNDKQVFDNVIQSSPKVPIMLWSGAMRTFPSEQLNALDIKTLILNNY